MDPTPSPILPYAIKCDECKTEIGRTASVVESAAGGRCQACKGATAPPLCPFPLMHYEEGGIHFHKPDGSACALLNDPSPSAYEDYDAYDDAGDREANARENDAIERGAEMWRREP